MSVLSTVGLAAATLLVASAAEAAPEESTPLAEGVTVAGRVPVTFQVAAGSDTVYAQGSNGSLYGWGWNYNGQVGDGSTTDRLTPVAVDTSGVPAESLPFRKVTAGGNVAYGLGADGRAYAWGANMFGQLGDGSTTDRLTPVAVDTSEMPAEALPFQTVVGGSFTAYALGANGQVYAWGYNFSGQVGDGSTTDRLTPVAVDTSKLPAEALPFQTVSAGFLAGYVTGANGQVYAWGDNSFGQLGDGTQTNSSTPVAVNTSRVPAAALPFRAVSTGANTAYGLGANGRVYAWGANSFGQVGDGSKTDRLTPVAVDTSKLPADALPFQTVVGSGYTTYALGTDGGIYSWGANYAGQLGDGTKNQRQGPVAVDTSGLPALALPFQAVSAGDMSGYGLGADGHVYAWGSGSSGQLGDGTRTEHLTPIPVVGLGVRVLEVTFGGVPGTDLSQVGGTWQVTAPGGCGPVEVVVRYRDDFEPAGTTRSVVYPGEFVYGAPPSVTDEPVSGTVAAGGKFTATVGVSDGCRAQVQWQSSTDGVSWTDVPGQTSPVLAVAGLSVTTFFRAVVTSCWTALDPGYTAISTVVTATVERPDDGGVDQDGTDSADDAGTTRRGGGPVLAFTGPAGTVRTLLAAGALVALGAGILVVAVRRRTGVS